MGRADEKSDDGSSSSDEESEEEEDDGYEWVEGWDEANQHT